MSAAHFSTVKKQQDIENHVRKKSCAENKENARSFSLKFQSIKPSSYSSKEAMAEKKNMTARSTKVDTTSILALYGADIDYNGHSRTSSDCIVQPRVRFA